MTLNEFKVHFLKFLKSSTVNLGRKTSKTRQIFIDEATKKFDNFMIQDVDRDRVIELLKQVDKDSSSDNKLKLQHMKSSVMRIKPKNRKRALDIGKGVHAMTAGESMRADEQLNRSPYVAKPKDKEIKE